MQVGGVEKTSRTRGGRADDCEDLRVIEEGKFRTQRRHRRLKATGARATKTKTKTMGPCQGFAEAVTSVTGPLERPAAHDLPSADELLREAKEIAKGCILQRVDDMPASSLWTITPSYRALFGEPPEALTSSPSCMRRVKKLLAYSLLTSLHEDFIRCSTSSLREETQRTYVTGCLKVLISKLVRDLELLKQEQKA